MGDKLDLCNNRFTQTILHSLKSRDRVPVSSKNKIQTFSGEVTMINDNGKWYIDNMNAHKTDEHIE